MSRFFGTPTSSVVMTAGSVEILGLGTAIGTTVTGGAADTKGSYATIGTSTFAYEEFVLDIVEGGFADSYRIDVAYNDGSDHVVVTDLPWDGTLSANHRFSMKFQVHIPSGATVKVRFQADGGASRTLLCLIAGYSVGSGGNPGKTAVHSCTDFNASETLAANPITQAGVAGTWSAWTTLCASTANAVQALWVGLSRHADSTRTADSGVIEVAIGAAASEVPIGAIQFEQSTSVIYGGFTHFDYLIAAGSRISYRVQMVGVAADAISIGAVGLGTT